MLGLGGLGQVQWGECWTKGEQDKSRIVGTVAEWLIVGCRMLLVEEVERDGGDKGDQVMKVS
jgi:hypothetical protein